jgi:prepilin-type N-terminal cleavage/methylation domain-containing protein
MLKQKGFTLIELMIVVAIIAILIIALGGFGSSNSGGAISAAEASGFQNVKVVSTHRWVSASFHGCSDRDWKATVVTATNPIGKTVTMTVCEGFWFKGATIRH